MSATGDAPLSLVLHAAAQAVAKSERVSLRIVVETFRSFVIEQTLKEAKGNVSEAARRLDVHRNTIHNFKRGGER